MGDGCSQQYGAQASGNSHHVSFVVMIPYEQKHLPLYRDFPDSLRPPDAAGLLTDFATPRVGKPEKCPYTREFLDSLSPTTTVGVCRDSTDELGSGKHCS